MTDLSSILLFMFFKQFQCYLFWPNCWHFLAAEDYLPTYIIYRHVCSVIFGSTKQEGHRSQSPVIMFLFDVHLCRFLTLFCFFLTMLLKCFYGVSAFSAYCCHHFSLFHFAAQVLTFLDQTKNFLLCLWLKAVNRTLPNFFFQGYRLLQ